ncbi:hypothetical protein FRC07_005726 [Ceratobasidium sp. 392]|nr:hypothetical protein FRC07_005726 [Ceratobasidium sp. 392]
MPQLSSPVLSSNHPSLLTSATDTSVQVALHTWKSARILLADAIQSYLSACATLSVACARPTHTPLERTVVEDALVAVDSELTSLTSEAKALRDAQVGLSTLRNKSGKLTRINALPPEILTYIFKLSTTYCMRDKAAKGCYNALARVDIYWRQLALDTPELWTHIDISPDAPTGRSLYEASKLQLERAKGEPVYLHLHELKQPYGTPHVEVRRLKDFLAPYAPRISALDMETVNKSQLLISSVLDACIDSGFSALQDLRIRVPEKSYNLYVNVH